MADEPIGRNGQHPMNPTVSFIVPCYKLAHLLPDCINSILGQTYRDFEILIMDDCSPDDTAHVARSFNDSRVTHVRNEPNLGHLRNYNKGIDLARGRFIWLISADDYLRRPYILERYVSVFEQHPQVGYVFCPGVAVRGGAEVEALDYSFHADHDTVYNGRAFLATLLRSNTILAASGCVRRECYDSISRFPLDMPWSGDWFLWAAFAFHHDVGYLAEPMVCYRAHELSMTNKLMREAVAQCAAEELAMPWIFKRWAEQCGDKKLVRAALGAAAYRYARCRKPPAEMSSDDCERLLCDNTASGAERRYVRAKLNTIIADEHYWSGNAVLARRFYMLALRYRFWQPKLWAKQLLLVSGCVGSVARRILRSRLAKRTGRPAGARQ